MGQLRDAFSNAQKAVRIDHKYGSAHIVLGQIYEKAVKLCQKNSGRKTVNYYDKLVYERANDEYKIALSDAKVKRQAQRLVTSIESLLPTKADRLMNPDKRI